MKIIRIVPLLLLLMLASCKKEAKIADVKYAIDSTKFDSFFKKYPEFADFKKEISDLYRKQKFEYVWYSSKDGRSDLAEVLYNHARQISIEGVEKPLPYREVIGPIIDDDSDKPDQEHDLLFSGMYFFYARHVLQGVDPRTSKQLGWYLPRERVAYDQYLAKLMEEPELVKGDTEQNIKMYYNLRKALHAYRKIEQAGGWGTISLADGQKQLKKGDKGPAVAQLRKRLAHSGDLASDSASEEFDGELEDAVKLYQQRHAADANGIVSKQMISDLNVPVGERIKTIVVNMERCRWLKPETTEAPEYIGVNIPSYRMRYVRDGKPVLESNVVVGKELNKTVIFSGMMSYLVFSPYWNVPKSILEKEIKPGIDADPDYLEKHNMEWDGETVRQRPGRDNSLGLVKFMFPNSNNIYLHDSPAKSLFTQEERALSHGCVRVHKARQLAIEILKGDKKWNVEKIDKAMNSEKEQHYTLNRKIPVYIAYFTAIADESGRVAFFEDIYKKDPPLAKIIYS